MLQFEWNHASAHDWVKIKRLFVAAYVGAYRTCDLKELDLDPDLVALAKAKNRDPLTVYFQHAFDVEFANIINQRNFDKFRINFLVVRLHDQPVAFIVSQLNFKSGRVYIRWNTVSPDFQRQGLGKKMLDEVAKHYNNSGLELYTRLSNIPACTFYPKHGLRKTFRLSFDEPMPSENITPYARVWLQDANYRNTMFAPEDERVHHADAYVGFCRPRLRVGI